MKIGINPGYFCHDKPETPFEDLCAAALLCKKYGFEDFDILTNIVRPDWEDHAKVYRAFADENGLRVHQSHAPFFRYDTSVSSIEECKPKFFRAVDCAAILGTKYLVIHADEYRLPAGETWNPEKVVAEMVEYFAPVIARATEKGINVAVENLFEDGRWGRPRSRCCSTVEELLPMIEGLRKYGEVSCCWDFGHAHVAFGGGDAKALRACAPYLSCTHTHDNYHGDDHLLPFLGQIDWTAQTDVLREAGYNGNITLELVYGNVPAACADAFLAYAKTATETLVHMCGK